MDPERQHRLDEVAKVAAEIEQGTGVPALAIVTQWALESKWGAKPVGQANYFGIKKAKRHTKSCTVTTHEVIQGQRVKQELAFADYDDLSESCRDYAWLISNGTPYRAAWEQYQRDRDGMGLLRRIARVYATNPGYADLAIRIAGQANVQAAITAARSKGDKG